MSRPSVPGFSHRIEVDKNLVRLLSEHTYTSFTNCIRELVVNAYDADATKVTIDVEPPGRSSAAYAGTLTITDNGHGMSAEDFLRYTRIAPGGLTRERSRTFGRLRVGKFGIGYLASFPFCDVLEMRTRTGTGEEIVATFSCSAYFRDVGKFQAIEDIPVEAKLEHRRSPELKYKSGTQLQLRGLSSEARAYLGQPVLRERGKGTRVPSIWDWNGLKRLEWELGQMLPIRWQEEYEDWQVLLGLGRSKSDPGLEVFLNNKPIEKPWPTSGSSKYKLTKEFPREDEDVEIAVAPPLELRDQHGDGVQGATESKVAHLYRYLVVSPHGPIAPHEFRGIQLRVRGVGIGLPMTYRDIEIAKEGELVRYLIEVHLVGGFDEHLTLDRSQLKKTPWFRSLLRDLERRILGSARKLGVAESRLQRDVDTVRKLVEGGSIEPIDRTLSNIEQHAVKMDYRIERRDIAPAQSYIAPEERLIVLPAASPRPMLFISAGKSLEIIEGLPTDATLKSDWVRIKQNYIEVAPELRNLGISTNQYRQLLQRLAIVEWRRVEASRGKSPEVQRELNRVARRTKADLVDMEKR